MIEAIPPLSWFFLFAFGLNGLLTIAILILKNKSLRAANLMLAINLVGISLATFHVSLVESRLILDVPHFYRLPSPVGYLQPLLEFFSNKLEFAGEEHCKGWIIFDFLKKFQK